MNLPTTQLYDLDTDPKESNNLHTKHPEIVEQLTAVFRKFVENGRKTAVSCSTTLGCWVCTFFDSLGSVSRS